MIDIQEALREVSFEIKREPLRTKDGIDPGKDVILRADNNTILGVLGVKKEIIPYAQTVQWVGEAGLKLGLNPQLHTSKLSGEGARLYQEWVLDAPGVINDPDGNPINPMMFVESSYAGGSTQFSFGTFRLICTNGAKVTKIFDRIMIKAGAELLTDTIPESIKYMVDRYARVSDMYKKLSEKSFNPLVWQIFMEQAISMALKKELIQYMVTDGIASTPEKYNKRELLVHPEQIVQVQKDVSAWYLYNVLTAIATHKARTVSARSAAYRQISKAFDV